MDERAAHDVLLVKAIETTDRDRRILNDDDRRYASRSARELAQWTAAERKQALTPDLFLHKRAQQLLARLAERTPAAAALLRPRPWMRIAGLALPLLAFLAGILADRIGDVHRVNLLSAPLLLILLWNLAVYVLLLVRPLLPRRALRRRLDGLRRPMLPRARRAHALLGAALARFGEEWLALAAPLSMARGARILHACAALLAAGAALSLYLRGVLAAYRVGWESTFLDASQVHALLSWLFLPAVSLFGLNGFSLQQVDALRFGQPAPPDTGAQWVHLYAATLLLLVVVPRLALAALAYLRERRLARRFPLDLAQPYFQRLCAGLAPGAATLRVCPYSMRVDEARHAGLASVARALLGEQADLTVLPVTAYGDMPPAPAASNAVTVALFALSATPEPENHGQFLDQLRSSQPAGLVALIDESGYLERLGPQAAPRAAERAGLWRQFCAQHQTPAAIVNLLAPDTGGEELERLLGAARSAS
jgi:hypothetical protein